MIGGPAQTSINTPNVLNPTTAKIKPFSPTSRMPLAQMQFGGGTPPAPGIGAGGGVSPIANNPPKPPGGLFSGTPSFGGTVDASKPNSAYTNAIKNRLSSIKGSNGVI